MIRRRKPRHVHTWTYSHPTAVGYQIATCTGCGEKELA